MQYLKHNYSVYKFTVGVDWVHIWEPLPVGEHAGKRQHKLHFVSRHDLKKFLARKYPNMPNHNIRTVHIFAWITHNIYPLRHGRVIEDGDDLDFKACIDRTATSPSRCFDS